MLKREEREEERGLTDTRFNKHFPETNGIGECCLRDVVTNKARIKWLSHNVMKIKTKPRRFKSAPKESLMQSHTLSLSSRWEYDRKHSIGAPTHTYSCTHTCILWLFVWFRLILRSQSIRVLSFFMIESIFMQKRPYIFPLQLLTRLKCFM